MNIISTTMENSSKVNTSVLVETTKSWDGSAFPAYPTGTPQVVIKHFFFPPHAVTDWHSHPVINAGMILSGELTIVCENGEEKTFKAGEPIVEISNRKHRGENRTDSVTEMVMFYASTPGEPLAVND
jgi:quercetin dioxygenase-like cupin family protein